MFQNLILDLPNLETESFENIFEVETDKDGFYYYNLLRTISFPQDLPPIYFTSYTIQPQDSWPLISYKTYRTTNLWWIIAFANNILNPTAALEVGTVLRIPISDLVQNILAEITS